MRNRDALAGVMVFSSAANAPIAADFQDFGDRAIVVLDKEDGDDRALRLACMWARWVVRRALAGAAADVDVDQLALLVGRARRALEARATVRRYHTQAKNAIDESARQVDAMVAELDAALAGIEEEVRR
jgi:hypothetical protein